MRRVFLIASALAWSAAVQPAASAGMPRECPSCGAYAGPNLDLVYDPYLRQADVWPEFHPGRCRFEVAVGVFTVLDRAACHAERRYRAQVR